MKYSKELTANELTKQLKDYLNKNGFKVWRQNNLAVKGRKFIGERGIGDLIGMQKGTGRFISIECKAGSDTLSEYQIQFINRVRANGGLAASIREIKELIIYLETESLLFKCEDNHVYGGIKRLKKCPTCGKKLHLVSDELPF